MIYYEDRHTGRHRGRHSNSCWCTLESIAQIAAKYNLDPKLLLDAFTKAWTHEKWLYEPLEIICRQVNQDTAIFLIMVGEKVVWQFPIEIGILRQPESFKSEIPIIPASFSKEPSPSPIHIANLKNKMRDVTVEGKIIEVPMKTLVDTRFGSEAYVSNVLLEDSTGTIRLTLWNDQISEVAVGDMVSIENAKVAMFCGMPQLRIGKSGILRVNTGAKNS